MLRKFLFLLFPLLSLSYASGNQFDIDSLKAEYAMQSAKSDTSLAAMNTLGIIGGFWYKQNMDSAIFYFHKSAQLALRRNKIEEITNRYRGLSTAYIYWDRPERALQILQKLWVYLNWKGIKHLLHPLIGDIAGIYFNAGYYQTAKVYLTEQLELGIELKIPPNQLTGNLSNLGFACLELAVDDSMYFDTARYFFNLALEEAKTLDRQIHKAVIYDYLAELEFNCKNYNESEAYLRQELQAISQDVPNSNPNLVLFRGRAYYRIAKVYSVKELPDSVLKYCDKAISLWQLLGSKAQREKRIQISLMQSKAYEQKGAIKLATSHLSSARIQAQSLVKEEDRLAEVYEASAQFHSRQGNFRKAFEAQTAYSEIKERKNKQSNKWFFFSNHSMLMNTVLELKVDQEQQATAQAIRIRNQSLGGVAIISILFVLVLFLFRNLRASNRQNRSNAKQLASINQTKDKLISVLAHDLRSPFHSLMGMSVQLEQQINDLKIRRAKNSARIIGESSREAYYLFENLLGWAKSQTGKLPYQPEQIDLEALLKETLKVVHGMAQAKKIKIISQIESPWAYGDPQMVKTILRNLIGNAIKFSNEDSEVHIKIREEFAELSVTVTDTGPGLNAQELNDLQTGLFHGKSGNGLGLILCSEFAEAHGGPLIIESAPSVGSSFSFKLSKGTALGEFNKSSQVVFEPEKSLPPMPYSSAWGADNEEIAKQLKELKVYENSKAKNLLNAMNAEGFPKLDEWKDNLVRALDEFNEREFQQLLEWFDGATSEPA